MKNLERQRRSSVFLILSLLTLVFLPVIFSEAETLTPERRAQLEQELSVIENQISEQQNILNQKKRESVTLERDIDILNANIQKARLNIRAREIAIANLSNTIGEKEKTIGILNEKLDKERESLAAVIRRTNEAESFSLPEILMGYENLSDFLRNIDEYAFIKEALRRSFYEIEDNRNKTADEKNDLEEKRNEQVALKTIQELEKRRIEEQEAEKKRILKISKGIEAEYQKLIKAKETDAAKIRAELFILRGSAAIPFEKALALAKKANEKTGVRPAFILGIIAEESNLGENVGTGNWRVDMANPRDTVPFKDITARLGLNPDEMPVSKKAWYGYGGAMGPAQFIPSTWVLYEARVAEATGNKPPNPWDPEDAFMASALYLKDSGAAKQTVSSERYAALCYLAGCKNANKKSYQFYADDVMELAEKYQKQINILGAN